MHCKFDSFSPAASRARVRATFPALALAAALAFSTAAAPASAADRRKASVYRDDVAFALDELEKNCGHFIKLKEVDWREVRSEFTKAARKVDNDEDHWVLLVRLVARLKDGHASVRPTEPTKDLQWPLAKSERQRGPGMFWCRSGGKILVKNAWSAAAHEGVRAGMEVVRVDRQPVDEWLAEKMAERADLMGYSTDHQAFFAACHWGLADDEGSRMSLDLRTPEGRKRKYSFNRRGASYVPSGPAFPPGGLEAIGRQSYGKTGKGYGYIHLRDVPGDLPAQFDTMLGKIGNVPGLILDCRANGGGGGDHDAVLGRFVPEGKKLKRRGAGPIPSAGPNPYGGPVVVIVDAGVRSAGETISGMFKEDGRGYMIGDSPTAGMSSSKRTLSLPSGLFNLYVSVASNKSRFQGGKGIEGIGIIPHEIVEYQAEDLDAGIDTLIRRAEAILADFPQSKVPYDPGDYGWGR